MGTLAVSYQHHRTVTHPTKIETLARQISLAVPGLGAWRRRFLAHILALWPAVLGRRNFVNLARQGDFTEFTYRKHFGHCVDWLAANCALVAEYLGPRRIVAIDATYLRKAGRHTDGAGYFHSGVHGQRRWGLEITALAAVDLDTRQALHLEAVQTLADDGDGGGDGGVTALEYFASIVEARAETLCAEVGDIVVGDAFYSREPFIGRVCGAGLRFVSKLRKNAALRYYYTGPQSGRGRPKMYGERVDLDALDPAVFTREEGLGGGGEEVWSGVVDLRASGRAIRLVVVRPRSGSGAPRLYMSTDVAMAAAEVLEAYGARFAQEFLFRDAKQFAGLQDGQGRSWQKVDYHANAALTAVNLAKCAHHLGIAPEERPAAFSMASVTQAYANERLALRVFSRCGIDPHRAESRAILRDIRNYACRAA